MAVVCGSPFPSNEINMIFTKQIKTKEKHMSTTIIDRDLTKHAPHSPRDHVAGFAIASLTVDKCRASMAERLGEYHYDCPLDNQLFSFKGINGEQFKSGRSN